MQIEIFLTFKKWIVELLFPSRCVGCNIEGVWLCQECAEVIEVFPPEVCPICQGMTSDYQLCQKCRRHYNFSKVLIRSRYQNSTVRSIIQGIKYNYIKDLRSSFVPLFQDQFEDYFKQTEIDYILIPVPLHKKRLKQREYNQSELLADSISKIYQIQIKNDLIERVRNTTPQAKLSKNERIKNCEDIFEVNKVKDVFQNTIFVIIDDVFTTGSTINACAKKLSTLKPREIWGLVVAHD